MEINIPKTSTVIAALLRADFTTQWRNRRSIALVLTVPLIIVFSWKGLVDKIGGPFVLSNALTLGLIAIGLMGYTNSLARDREKGIFQRLRVSPAPTWAIMASRLVVQLALILLLTVLVLYAGYSFDHIRLSVVGYMITFFSAIVGGSVFLSLGQAIVGNIKNPETVNSTTRLFYFCFILIGTVGPLLDYQELKDAVQWTPYGTVKTILAGGMEPVKWDIHTTSALLASIGYTVALAALGIKWFKWDSK